MKITTFLKKYSLIDNKFIDDFYTFYDDGKNEYDFTINLDLVASWLNVRKDHLKTLLKSNFIVNSDFIEQKESGKKGKGVNNTIHVLLTYTCSKLLCMISKSEKSNLIRNYYVDLEKLIITYKDNIVNDLNNQLGIQTQNNEIVRFIFTYKIKIINIIIYILLLWIYLKKYKCIIIMCIIYKS